jgi:glutamate synthase domain-containing protein 2/glutamate synthase domain-containing protein 1/glutamate synthase domain-containing protein 3
MVASVLWSDSVDHDACGVGFVAQLGSPASRAVVERALTALLRLTHRGGVDADGSSGDGAGLLVPIPDAFVRKCARDDTIELPESFGLGMVFLPPGSETPARAAIESIAEKSGLRCLGWRIVPTNPLILGPRALATLPVIRWCYFAAIDPAANLERLLYLMRKRAEVEAVPGTYFSSLSSRTVVYKGLLAPWQVPAFYRDLAQPSFTATSAVFHQRYSTNTSPTWRLAQPFRYVGHNGEINTIGANRRWQRARQADLRREFEAGDWLRPLEEGVSDSASFDNALENLLQRGYSLAAAILRMVPPAWESDQTLSPRLRRYLEIQAREQEPWDGPAAMVFGDGRMVGVKLDRNGLRPMRYTLTAEGLLIAGSEVGLADLQGVEIAERGRLGPGDMLLVDPAAGKIYRNDDLAELLNFGDHPLPETPFIRLEPGQAISSDRRPNSVPDPMRDPAPDPIPDPMNDRKRVAAALGWTDDQFRMLFQPLGADGKEAMWSMGDDAPPAFLSTFRRPIWDYCKQRFAQVTNPPIDPLRESYVMSLDAYIGRSSFANSPVLDAGQMQELESRHPVRRLGITYDVNEGAAGAVRALDRLRAAAAECAWDKKSIIVISDRNMNATHPALPILLATAAAWKALVRAGGCEIPIIVETGQVIETHHVALLVAVGANAVFPYLAMELSESLKVGGAVSYRAAVGAGLRKVMARMGISTLASYRNSHLFETIGIDEEVHDEFFEGAAAALGGKPLIEILEDSLARHVAAFTPESPAMHDAGLYRFRQHGERHATSPELVRRMHRYIKSPTDEAYSSFVELAEGREPVAIRDLFEISAKAAAVPLDEVEADSEILSRFSAQAMSLGALSPEAHSTLAIAMNRLGARSNTGEGGEDPETYHRRPEANNRVKQVASARFGVTAEYLVRADELEIKMAQGSKPGEGGQLPASKVSAFIARLRHAAPGMSLISPPPHHDIYSIEDLAQLIFDLRAINPIARIGVKLVSGAGVGIIAAGVAKAGADVITIAGHDGGTGASPLTSIKNTGLPWEIGLREAHNALLRSGFRNRVRLRADGGFKFGRDVIVAALLGADEFGFATAALLAIGCVMARQCHLNTCPVGIATQDEKLRARFAGDPEMVMTYFRGVAAEVRARLAALGARSLDEITGDASRLAVRHPQAARALAPLLKPAPVAPLEFRGLPEDVTGIHLELERSIARQKSNSTSPLFFPVSNSDRSVGAHLSGQILRRTVFAGVGARTLAVEFRGAAGQSFGAFLIKGIRFRLRGEANDYVAKSLSGGTIAVTSGPDASRKGHVLAGNTVLYGATSGELYIAGRAGERFAVRNSGALAVVEGVGLHGCEYMTAGVVLILGPAGINLCSGMTGGLTYILRDSLTTTDYHREFVRPGEISTREEEWLRAVLREHHDLTESPIAERMLSSKKPLPLVRLEPVSLLCSIEQTWASIRFRTDDAPAAPLAFAEPLPMNGQPSGHAVQ